MSEHDHRGDVTAHRCATCVEAWRGARSVADLAALGARWLVGELELQPRYFGAAPEPETDALVPALVALNRAGLWTTMSQPGVTTTAQKQRAYVCGYGSAELVGRILDATTTTDLVVLACPADTPGPFSVPITLLDHMPCTFAGRAGESPDEFSAELSRTAVAALWDAAHVEVLDPHWGRDHLLWDVLVHAVTAGR